MTQSSLIRYYNLLRNVRNWPEYFRHKGRGNFAPVVFTTRGEPIQINIPTLELYLVFKEIFLTDFYAADSWMSALPANPVVLDVGANAGYFDFLLLSRRPDARILAFEPVKHNVQLFQKTLTQNPRISGKAEVFQMAVTGKPMDEIALYKESDNDNSVTASVFGDFEKHNVKSVTVKAVSLEQILEKHRLAHVDFLKLDCEGSEYPIVYDSPASIWENIHRIFMEVHDMDKAARNLPAMKSFIESVGYRTSVEVATNGCYGLMASRK